MKLFLTGCVILFIFIALTLLSRARKPHQQATRRRTREDKQSFDVSPQDPVLGKAADSEDPDVVLGLKQAEEDDSIEEPPLPKKTAPQLECVVLHIMPNDSHSFGGYDLLQALLSNGFRYNAKDKIFHYYSDNSVLFSLTTVNKPGTFDLATMNQFYCPGLTVFALLNQVQQPGDVFEQLLETSYQLADDLVGEVWGQDRKPLSRGQIHALRQQIGQVQTDECNAYSD